MRRFIPLLFLLTMLPLSRPLVAADADLSLRQFDHTAWTLREGAPSQIFAIAQTRDGFLWLGTANGLFRFDGVKFELYQPPRSQRLPKASIQSPLATPDGGLWIGYTLGDTSFLKDGVLEDRELMIDDRSGTVWYMAADADGSIWAACSLGLSHYVENAWHPVRKESGFVEPSAYRVFFDGEHALWVVTDHMLYRKARDSARFENTGLNAGSNASLELGADGTIYATDEHGALTLDQLSRKQPQRHYVVPDDSLVEVRLDDRGSLWAVSTDIGVKRVSRPADASSPVERAANLTSDRATSSLVDREGTVWISTSGGLDRFRPFALNPAALPDTFGFYALAADSNGSILVGTEGNGLNRLEHGKISRVASVSMDRIATLLRGPDAKLWLGGQPTLGYLEGDHYVAIPLPEEIASSNGDTQAMAIARDGSLWVQSINNGPLMRWKEGAWSALNTPDQKTAVVLATDHLGRIWSGSLNGRIVIYDSTKPTELRPAEWSGVGSVTALHPSGSDMWIGGEKGLGVFSDGKARVLTFAGDTPIRGVSGIYRLTEGSLWLNSLPGILQIPSAEVTHALRDPDYAMHYRLFNNLDGLKGKAPQMRPLPSIVRSTDGLLWFSTTNGAVSIDPNRVPRNPVIPPVAITAVLANNKALDWGLSATIPKGSEDLVLRYTALSLSIPERVKFRYQLAGFDEGWQDAGVRREAFYPHLPPGHYVFKVIASNNDGLWNTVGASLPITLPPTFIQSMYFKALLASLVLATFWVFYVWRLRQATEMVRTRLFERFAERERIARDLHDTFFQGIQGLILSVQSASRRLAAGDPVRSSLEKTLAQSDKVMLQGRQLVLDLRTQSTEVNELGTALEAGASEAARGSSATFRMTLVGDARALNSLISDELYKLGCEAIINAYRHSEATLIEGELHYGKSDLCLSVRDNGHGISAAVLEQGGVDHHFGLPGMKERARNIGGELHIRNRTEGGVEILVRIPARLAYRSKRRH